jgi:pectin methylesterase-like acyl-CoA thioesterase
MMKRQFLLLFVALLLATLSSWATVRYVPGTYSTIQAAVASAVPGDEIQIAAGTFPIGSTVAINVPNLTITGAGVGSTIITGNIRTKLFSGSCSRF